MLSINYPDWKNQPWLFRQLRKISVPITWILLRTSLRPNDISLASIFVAVLAAIFFGVGCWYTAIFIMLIAVLLDFSDGEISRLQKLQSKEGSYLDKVYIFSVHPILVAGISIGTYYSSPGELLLVAGFINTICISLLLPYSAL